MLNLFRHASPLVEVVYDLLIYFVKFVLTMLKDVLDISISEKRLTRRIDLCGYLFQRYVVD